MAPFWATPNALGRYRPAVLIVIGAATAYCAYLAYTSATEGSLGPQKRTLQRRGAVRRRNDDRPLQNLAENEQPVPPRRRRISSEQIDGFIDIGEHHLPNFDSLDREFEWNSPGLTDFRCEVAYRSLLSLFQATFIPSADNAPNPYQEALIGELLARGISPAEVARAMTRAGTSEAVSRAIVENAADPATDHLPRITDPTTEPRSLVGSRHAAPQERQSGADIKSVLFYIAEEQSRQKAYVHHGIRCDSCGEMPIRGIRWHCSNCTDFDLCSNCEAQSPSPHIKTHVFHKITIPALHLSKSWKVEPVWYPGNPFLMQRTLPKDLVKQLSNDCSYEPFEVEAIYDQFTCVANVQWREDPLNINAAVDRSAFNRSIMPHTRLRPPAPNLIYERCFAFYDTDNNGLIGFDEFLHGLAYIHKKAFRDQRLLKIFDGYDMDSDGYVTRRDFLRMFRALYTVQQELTNDMIAVQEEQAADEPRSDLINSSQPLSSAFRDRFLPSSAIRRPGKIVDRFGDPLPASGYSTIAENSGIRATRADIIGMMETQAGRSPQSTEERSRRQVFYMDEEESSGVESSPVPYGTEACGKEDDQSDRDSDNESEPNQDEDLAPRSRSSSRVRFKDELEDDVRSQTSTSSRPVGERWGGYEIPEAESDMGKEIIYNVIQESLNLLLDPLFRPAEDLAMEVRATKVERDMWRDQIALVQREDRAIEMYNARRHDPLLETAKMHSEHSAQIHNPKIHDHGKAVDEVVASILRECTEIPNFEDCLTYDDYETAGSVLLKMDGYVKWALPYLEGTLDQHIVESCNQQYQSRVKDGGQDTIDAIVEKITGAFPSAPTVHPVYRRIKDLEQQAASARNLINSNSAKGSKIESYDGSTDDLEKLSNPSLNFGAWGSPLKIDPTFPQFRPNSSTDMSPLKRQKAKQNPAGTATRPTNTLLRLPTPPPPRPQLRHLAMLDQIEREQHRRGGGGGKLGFEEFERVMKGPAGTKLEFLDDWLTLISF